MHVFNEKDKYKKEKLQCSRAIKDNSVSLREQMKIFELFEPEFKDSRKTVDYNRDNMSKKASGKPSGMYSYVSDTPRDSGTITKTTYNSEKPGGSPPAIEGYYLWVKACSKYMKSNPALPRVYAVDDRTDASGDKYPRYKMERLYSALDDQIDVPMLAGILYKCGGDDAVKSYITQYGVMYHGSRYLSATLEGESGFYTASELDQIKESLFRFITSWCRTKYKNGGLLDKNITNAVRLARGIVDRFGGDWYGSWGDNLRVDMHTGNWMIRLTNVGPQLVMTDPIAGSIPVSKVGQISSDKKNKANELIKSAPERAKKSDDLLKQLFDEHGDDPLLKEQIEPQFKDTQKTVNYANRQPRKGIAVDRLGVGMFSDVQIDPRDPHMAIKTDSAYDEEYFYENAYYAWVQAIAPYMKSNPYLPRVYVVDDRTDSRGTTKPRYKMEKLHPFEDLSIDALMGMYENMTSGNSEITLKKWHNDIDRAEASGSMTQREDREQHIKYDIWRRIVTVENLKDAAKKDNSLAQALKIIKDLTKDGYGYDMHSGNFMVRLTPHGPQLVFTDPISNKD